MTANPYPGLRSFEAAEAELFFGRERETDDLRRRLRQGRFVAVVGASGSGKSSLVRCGLIPSLHAGFMSGAGSRWRVALLRPGDDPIGALAAALDEPAVLGEAAARAETRRTVLEAGLRDSSLGLAEAVRQAALPAGDNLLVVVDQFEELFRYRRSGQRGHADDAAAFVRLLLEATRVEGLPVYVVLTMRAEFIGDCMAFAGLPEAINAGQYLVPALTRDALRAAIGKPAVVSGSSIAPRLMVRLLNEGADDADRLPVLQHALMRTWDAWARDHAAGEPIDVRHYEAIGTVHGALSKHADEAWAELAAPREQAVAERLFKTLTETTEDGRGLRRPTAFGLLQAVCGASAAELLRVIDAFRAPGRAFLQPAAGVAPEADTVIDISHESLMRLWKRLVDWAAQEARATEIYRRLQRSARQHAAGEASLWRPPELTLGQRWRRENPTAGQLADPAEFAQVLQFLKRSERAQRLRVGVVALALVAAVGAAIGWLVADARREQAIAQAQREENARLQAQVRQLTEARAQAAAAQQQQLEEVKVLRAAHAGLKEAVAALDGERLGLLPAIARLREGNRVLESRLEVLAAEHGLLAQRSEALDKDLVRAQGQFADLAIRIIALGPVPATLKVQKQALRLKVDALQLRYTGLKRLVRETEPCDQPEAMADAVAVAPPMAFPPPPQRPKPGARPGIPADPGNSDALRRRIEALARELAELVEQRARLQDEAAWLRQANGLLEQQRAALTQEVAHLRQVQNTLQQRRHALEDNLRVAEADRKTLLEFIAGQEKRQAEIQAKLAEAAEEHRLLEVQAVGESAEIGQLNARSEALQAVNRGLVGRLAPIVENILKHAAGAERAPDLAAMLAVKAFRWAPYDTDDAATPAVYNGLWLALRRLDPKAAAALLAPGDPAAGKLATTRSEVMVKALCSRAARPFTEAEWQRYMPDGACFTPEAARACGP